MVDIVPRKIVPGKAVTPIATERQARTQSIRQWA
jgi:hypothetical protein